MRTKRSQYSSAPEFPQTRVCFGFLDLLRRIKTARLVEGGSKTQIPPDAFSLAPLQSNKTLRGPLPETPAAFPIAAAIPF